MKDDLRRLISEFLIETNEARRSERYLPFTNQMAPKKEIYTREATFMDFIEWLNDSFPEEE